MIYFTLKNDDARRAIVAGQATDGLYPVSFIFQSDRKYVGLMQENGRGAAAPVQYQHWQLKAIRDRLLYGDAWGV